MVLNYGTITKENVVSSLTLLYFQVPLMSSALSTKPSWEGIRNFLLIAALRKMPYFVLLRKKHQTSTNSTIFFFLLNAVKSLSLHKKFFFLQELLPRLLLEVFLHIFKSIAEFKKSLHRNAFLPNEKSFTFLLCHHCRQALEFISVMNVNQFR